MIKNGQYQVFPEHEWVKVPPEKLVTGTNRVGFALVWGGRSGRALLHAGGGWVVTARATCSPLEDAVSSARGRLRLMMPLDCAASNYD
jgi:hypothetical protein